MNRLFCIIVLLLSFVVTASAQSFSKPDYYFQEDDTFDMYAEDTLFVDNGYDASTGCPTGWKVDFKVEGSNIIPDYDKGKASFTIIADYHGGAEAEIHTATVNIINTSDTDTLLNVSKTFVIRVFQQPYANVIIRLCDDPEDEIGYIASSFMGKTDTIGEKTMTSYATHVLRVTIPSLSGDRSLWQWEVDGAIQNIDSAFIYQYSNEDANEEGSTFMYQIKVTNKLKYRKEPFVAKLALTCLIYPFPRAGVNTKFETYSGITGGFKLFHTGGIKDAWEHQWSDLYDNPKTDEEMENLCIVTDKKKTEFYHIYVRNGDETTGFYHGEAYLQFTVWPEPSSQINVSVGNPDYSSFISSDTIDVECEEGDTININTHVMGGYMGEEDAWKLVVTDCDSTYISDNTYGTVSFVTEDRGLESKNGIQAQTYKVKISNCYTGDGTTHDSIWYEKEYAINVRVHLATILPCDFALLDKNQNRTITSGYNAIRRGNTMVITRDDAQNTPSGKYNIQYHWSENGEVKTIDDKSWQTVVLTNKQSMKKATDTYEIQFQSYKYDSQGNELGCSEIAEQTITVYNRPHTPTSLVTKGNGVSHTLIATSDVSDANLRNYDYYLVFGYEKADGTIVEKAEIVQSGTGKCRFDTSFSSVELTSTSNRFFVYAQWCYDNGVTITSGKRYMDSVDEEWDGSDYSGKGGSARLTRRTDTTDITNTNDYEESVVHTITLDGKVYDHTTKGISIIKMSNGTTRKVYNK